MGGRGEIGIVREFCTNHALTVAACQQNQQAMRASGHEVPDGAPGRVTLAEERAMGA